MKAGLGGKINRGKKKIIIIEQIAILKSDSERDRKGREEELKYIEGNMNSSRPRTLLLNQTFQCISSLEEFSRIDNATLSDSSLNQSQYHLHHPLHSKPNENNVQTPSKTSCLVDNAPKPK